MRPRVRQDYFDGSQPVSHWGTEDALTVLADLEAGSIDASADTGLDGANQALLGELFDYALRLFNEEGDRPAL